MALLSGTRRFDLVAYRTSGKPWAVIEVKHRIASNSITLEKDLCRLAEVVLDSREDSSICLGCLLVYLECGPVKRKDTSPKHRIERKQDELIDWAKQFIKKVASLEVGFRFRISQEGRFPLKMKGLWVCQSNCVTADRDLMR